MNYRPSTNFTERSNKRGKEISDAEYEEKRCKGENCMTVNLPTDAQREYSIRVFGRVLCWNCQSKETTSGR